MNTNHPKIAALLLVFTFGCTREAPFSPPRTALGDVQEVTGVTDGGALYAFRMPDAWNGDLVLYAHGFIDPAAPIALPGPQNDPDDFLGFRDELVARGYAVGYSSFSRNGFAVKEGVQDTHRLRGLFTASFGPPDDVYITGHSLGGLVAVNLMEQHPEHYTGGLAMCGLLGGSQAAVDYVGHLRILFDYFFPGVVPGSVDEIPEQVDLLQEVILPVQTAIVTDLVANGGQKALAIAQIDQTPLPFIPTAEALGPTLTESYVRAIGFQFRGFADLIDRTHGHFPFDNAQTTYSSANPALAALLTGLNATVPRIEADVDARNSLRQYYEPDGRLERPLMTLHNRLDPVAPILHEASYGQKVAQAGRSDLLDQRLGTLPYGHCEFDVVEMAAAFADLVFWADDGS